MQSITILLFFLLSASVSAEIYPSNLKPLAFDGEAVHADLRLIEKAGSLTEKTLDFKLTSSPNAEVKVICSDKSYLLEVKAPAGEETATLYKGLRELGFLFPHPVWQLTPTQKRMKLACGKTYPWRPSLKWRGSHLHTLHPNEWVHGFFLGKTDVANSLVRWLARNNQNLLDLSLLRVPLPEIKNNMSESFKLARSLGIHTGVSLGIALQQQKSFKLLPVWQSFLGWGSDKTLTKNLELLIDTLPLSFVVLEAGTSEFTPTNYEKTLEWLNLSSEILAKKEIALFTKIHVSSNQTNKKFGNYNFLPSHANPKVGVLPHTVMFYGLLDSKAPMYGNKNFKPILEFTLKEKDKRPTWYYPETSYWVGLDVDIPLLLTEYLRTRAEDMQWLYENKIEGQLNFTSGHALGGWLLDWNLALMTDLDYNFDPTMALRFLDEPIGLWNEHIGFQKKWMKEEGLISMLSAANLQDEISASHRIHERRTLKELRSDVYLLKKDVSLLDQGLQKWPEIQGIKNVELKALMLVTKLRHEHALKLRLSLVDSKDKTKYLKEAESLRLEAYKVMQELKKLPTNYPDLPLFELHANPTSYKFGYVYPAGELFFWKREETQIQEDSFFPFKNSLYDMFEILF